MLLYLLPHLHSMADVVNLVKVLKRFCRSLSGEVYRESWRINWLPLFLGAQLGSIKMLEWCLEVNAPLDQRWHDSSICWDMKIPRFCRPIHTAIKNRQVEAVKWLLEKKADPGSPGYDPYLYPPPLEMTMPMTLKESAVGLRDSEKRTRIELDNVTMFRALIVAKADPNVIDTKCDFLLRRALLVRSPTGVSYFAPLLKGGANPNQLCSCTFICGNYPFSHRKKYPHLHPTTDRDLQSLGMERIDSILRRRGRLCPSTWDLFVDARVRLLELSA
ncbi:hypothetical protein BKA56DRAFT_684612 [Ilyonectria sp. MPI-CAGE-AT-0026]|nr:hypothetical protein BKA56DRAFT_684612 [Ilyonectria sp. MPI-CAGE-AT-0026]